MILHTTIAGKGDFIKANRVKRPKFAGRGRTWDYVAAFVCDPKREISDTPTPFWIDTTWGRAYYFEWLGSWYRVPANQNGMIYDLDIMRRRYFQVGY